ncbi:unnamed protein product [Schistocephalus solidus]|uniref:Uncharacterized protein n=1 Tax=Schistocephalus solidus TaxID=70667 RepID=A0A183T180_SCHSO|nr:unnamed protein product [Schistocephalus solidus]
MDRVRTTLSPESTLLAWFSRKSLRTQCDLSVATKIRASVRSVLLYGCESWTVHVEDERRLEIFDHRCLRTILRMKYTDYVSNEAVRTRSYKVARISQSIQERRLGWFGHVLRHPPRELSSALDPAALPPWRRRKGGQLKTCLDAVRQDMEEVLGPSVFGVRRWSYPGLLPLIVTHRGWLDQTRSQP